MRRAWIAGAVVAALIAGCGGGGSSGPQTAKDVAEAYVNARNSGDAAKVCELYSQQLIQQLKTSNCVAFVQEQTSGTATDLTVLGVKENGNQATATIQAKVGGSIANAIAPIELQLTRDNGEWKVSGLGGPGNTASP
jgi:D-arabinose 1-dehydrogenase-like Zn-dependent alcohol dehydrogenase